MLPPVSPSLPLRQQVWDNAARAAARGLSLPAITDQVLAQIQPRLAEEVAALVPRRGRSFSGSLAKAMIWALAVDVLLAMFGPGMAGSVPYLQPILLSVVVIWGFGFGVMAGNQRVSARRVEVRHGILTALETLAEKAAFRVWAAEVPGTWQPLGPAPARVPATAVQPADWLRRFGLTATDAVAVELDELDADAGSRVRVAAARGGGPVVGFVREPGFFDDDTRARADEWGMALFVLGARDLLPMSAVASAVLRAYTERGAGSGPADEVRNRWRGAASVRTGAS